MKVSAASTLATLLGSRPDSSRLYLVIILCVAGCQGQLSTHPASREEAAGTYEGVKFYPTSLVKEMSKTTVAIKDGKIVASSLAARGSAPYCHPVVMSRYIVAADFSHPMIVKYSHGLLETYTFNPTLSDGMLTGVNTVSTPDSGKTFNNIATGIGSFAGGVLVVAEPPKPNTGEFACTDGAVVIGRQTELPKSQTYGTSNQ